MKSILLWSGLSAAILLTALILRALPGQYQAGGLMVAAFLATGAMVVKICRGSP